jgi:hypothetical protein
MPRVLFAKILSIIFQVLTRNFLEVFSSRGQLFLIIWNISGIIRKVIYSVSSLSIKRYKIIRKIRADYINMVLDSK